MRQGAVLVTRGRSGSCSSSVRHTFNGQYLWVEARPAAERDAGVDGRDMAALSASYASREQELLGRWSERVDRLRERGGVAIWGAGAKGATFAQLVDQELLRIECVVDLNPRKQGRFLAGTGHPIVGYRDLPSREVRSAVVMNPNYLEEIHTLVEAAGLSLALHCE